MIDENVISGGSITNNRLYNNGTNLSNPDSLRAGIHVVSDTTQKVYVGQNHMFNLPDSGNLNTNFFNLAETLHRTQQYGLFVTDTDAIPTGIIRHGII